MLFRMMAVEPLLSRSRKMKLGIMPYHAGHTNLEVITQLIEGGTLKPVVDSVYPLAKVSEAFRHFMSGNFCGKIVIEV